MEKIDWNRVKTTIRNWKPGEYIRQTSIVVIGVLITFVGSELVTRCSEQKDIKSTMLLIRDELKNNRKNFEKIVSEFSADERLSALLVEHDMNGMRQEMEKLICYVGHRQVIEKADVDAVCCVFVENKVFDMISAVAEKNQKRAMQLYDDLVALKEPPMRILYLMIKQFNTLYEVRDLAVKGYPASAIAEKTAIRDFIVKRNISLGRHFEIAALREAVAYGTELEEEIKTGRITDRLAVELMIQKYSRA